MLSCHFFHDHFGVVQPRGWLLESDCWHLNTSSCIALIFLTKLWILLTFRLSVCKMGVYHLSNGDDSTSSRTWRSRHRAPRGIRRGTDRANLPETKEVPGKLNFQCEIRESPKQTELVLLVVSISFILFKFYHIHILYSLGILLHLSPIKVHRGAYLGA